MLSSHSFSIQSSNTDNLTSKVNNKNFKKRNNFNQNLNKEKTNFKPQFSEFTHTIAGTTISTKRNLEHLTDLNQQSLTQWIINTKHTLKLFAWEEEIASKVLQSIIEIHLLPQGTYNTTEEIYRTLIKKKYTKQSKLILNKRLYEIFQKRDESISQYLINITKAAEELAVINNESNTQTKKKIKEIFLKNLNKSTKLLALDKDLTEPEEIVEYITQREEIFKQDSRKEYGKINYQNKYCKYHKTKTHSTEECYKLKSKNSSNYLFKENCPKFKLPIIKIFINNLEAIALLDTGSTENFITKGLIEKALIKTEITGNREIELANQSKVNIKNKTKLEFKINNIPNTIYKTDALVLDKSGYDIILGNEFLKNFSVILDYKRATVNIDGTEIVIDEEIFEHNKQDELITNKTKIYNINTDEEIINRIQNNIISPHKKNNPELGEISLVEHTIEVTDQNTIKFKQYKTPEKFKDMVQNEVKRLLKLKIIRYSNSNYCSPAFPIIKRNNSIRLVVDYQELNKKTIKMPYPIPAVRDLLIDFKQAKVFSTIDLSMGYYQIKMEEKSKKFTSFIINNQQYEFNRLPFGLKNAPMTFQMSMNKIFANLRFVKIYLDDIIIFSKSIEEHEKHLETVFKIIKENNISVNFDKSEFCKGKITFLGNEISQKGITPAQERIKNIETKNIKTKKGLQKLLGYINWYRPYLPNLSRKLVNITNKLKDKEIFWSTEDQKTVQEIINEINSKPVLKFPDFSKKFILETDASNKAIGAVLKQEDELIDCFSKKLNNTQTNYSVMEKELLAILMGLERFRNIILGSKILIYTDNSNILSSKLTQTPRIKRWKYLLNEYDYELKYIKGIKNKHADTLSRIYNTNINKTPTTKITIPDHSLNEFIGKKHIELGHPNGNKLYETLKRHYINKNLNKQIKKFSGNCLDCAKEKRNKRQFKLNNLSHYSNKFNHKICSDIYGPIHSRNFDTEENGNIYFFVFVDTYSRLTRIYFTRDITAKDLINSFKKWIKEFKKPEIIFSDRGRQYTSEVFKRFCKTKNIKREFTPPYSPRSNGLVERRNSSLGNLIRIFRGKEIKFIIDKAHNFFNKTVLKNMKITPEEIYLNKTELKANKKNNLTQKSNKPQLKILDRVLLYRPTTSKTQSPYNGPFTVKKIVPNQNAALIENENKESLESIFNLKRLS